MVDVSIVVPVYRSEDCLVAFETAVDDAMRTAALRYELLLVDDGSPDGSWSVIRKLAERNAAVRGLRHRRNFGQDNAIMTGLRHATGGAVVIMDDDLQHSPADIPPLYAALAQSGADVVYAHFSTKRQAWWKNVGSWFNGKFAEWLIEKPADVYLSPFKIVRREVIDLVTTFDGPYPYVDGILFQVTDRFSSIPAEHHERFSGTSGYTVFKSVQTWGRLAISFSVRPLRLVTWMGFLACFLGFLGAALIIVLRVINPDEFAGQAAGWASLIVSALVLSGMQMLSLGLLGEYVGRTYANISRKPQAAVAETVAASKAGDQ